MVSGLLISGFVMAVCVPAGVFDILIAPPGSLFRMIAGVLVAAQHAHAVFKLVRFRRAAALLLPLFLDGFITVHAVRPNGFVTSYTVSLRVTACILCILISGFRPCEFVGTSVFIAAVHAGALPEVMFLYGAGHFIVRAKAHRFAAEPAVEIVGLISTDAVASRRNIGIRCSTEIRILVSVFVLAGVFETAGCANTTLKVMFSQGFHLFSSRLSAPKFLAVRAVAALVRIAADDMTFLAIGRVLCILILDPGVQLLMLAGIHIAALHANTLFIIMRHGCGGFFVAHLTAPDRTAIATFKRGYTIAGHQVFSFVQALTFCIQIIGVYLQIGVSTFSRPISAIPALAIDHRVRHGDADKGLVDFIGEHFAAILAGHLLIGISCFSVGSGVDPAELLVALPIGSGLYALIQMRAGVDEAASGTHAVFKRMWYGIRAIVLFLKKAPVAISTVTVVISGSAGRMRFCIHGREACIGIAGPDDLRIGMGAGLLRAAVAHSIVIGVRLRLAAAFYVYIERIAADIAYACFGILAQNYVRFICDIRERSVCIPHVAHPEGRMIAAVLISAFLAFALLEEMVDTLRVFAAVRRVHPAFPAMLAPHSYNLFRRDRVRVFRNFTVYGSFQRGLGICAFVGTDVLIAALHANTGLKAVRLLCFNLFTGKVIFPAFAAVRAVVHLVRIAGHDMTLRAVGLVRGAIIFSRAVRVLMRAGVLIATEKANATLKVVLLQMLNLFRGRLVAPFLTAIHTGITLIRITGYDMTLRAA